MKHHASTNHHENTLNKSNTDERILYPWEKSCHALLDILERKNLVTLQDKIEKWAEISPNGSIDGDSYYEHWILATTQVLIANGLLHHEEINKKTHEIALRFIQKIITIS